MEKNITPDSVISALMNHTKSADSDFPVHVFPAKMQRIILELNTTCAFPIDYTASAMLAAISVAIGNTTASRSNAVGRNRLSYISPLSDALETVSRTL